MILSIFSFLPFTLFRGYDKQLNLAKTRLPLPLIWFIWAICLLPFCFNLLGINFDSSSIPFEASAYQNLAQHEIIDKLHYTLSGSFVHTILEWSAFCAAIFTVVLALTYFKLQRDGTTLIIAIALFCSGIMDAFHTLAADRLIEAVADNRNLIPFTWAICRLANALLTIIGVSIFIFGKSKKLKTNIYLLLFITCLFGLISYGIIYFCATQNTLPKTIFPDSFITRPWDFIPLILFVIAGFFIYPRFDAKYPSIFSHGLVISTIPNAITQLHMTFGSTALFDNDFNIAHFLKIIAYLVPLSGLILDYSYTYKQLDRANLYLNQKIVEQEETSEALKQSENQLKSRNDELKNAVFELKNAQTQLIQTEKMSSLGQMVAGIAHEINNPVNFIYGNIIHIDNYSQDLINLINLYRAKYPQPDEEIEETIEEIDLDFLETDLPKMIQSIHMGANRIREMVLSLRNFSRLDEAEVKEVNIHEGIDSTLVILNNRIKQGINLIKEYEDLPLIECYPAQLNQVWMNLITNSIDALETEKQQQKDDQYHPTLTIITKAIKNDDDNSCSLQRSPKIMIIIKDNGCGLPEELKEKIFDPFFTTKPIGKGTGLGLSICYQIIEKHQGQINVDSTPSQGTEFAVIIPISQNIKT
jgi:two-component system, NtrC family, sensor kinase